MKEIFQGKKILIIGGAGSVGKASVLKLLEYNPKEIRIFDIDESKEFDLRQRLKSEQNVKIILGDIRDKESLQPVMKGIDIVFHTAALKHVTACEYDPFEAVKTNILGIQNVITTSKMEEVEKVIFTSSDKAVNPTSTMGITKLMGEKLITRANHSVTGHQTRFYSVRFGNILGSRGSLLPLLKQQVSKGGPITITDIKMTRFVMGMSQAINLILKSAKITQGGENIILKMPALRITDLGEVIIEELAPKYGYAPGDIETKIIGIYPGEKLYEELITDEESTRSFETEDMLIILPQLEDLRTKISLYPDAKTLATQSYNSKDTLLLTKDEIRDLLYREDLLRINDNENGDIRR